jgi:hypothetical protein
MGTTRADILSLYGLPEMGYLQGTANQYLQLAQMAGQAGGTAGTGLGGTGLGGTGLPNGGQGFTSSGPGWNQTGFSSYAEALAHSQQMAAQYNRRNNRGGFPAPMGLF